MLGILLFQKHIDQKILILTHKYHVLNYILNHLLNYILTHLLKYILNHLLKNVLNYILNHLLNYVFNYIFGVCQSKLNANVSIYTYKYQQLLRNSFSYILLTRIIHS